MEKKNPVKDLFTTIEENNWNLPDVIIVFNKEFNSFQDDAESDETRKIREVIFGKDSSIEDFRFGMQEAAIRNLIKLYPRNTDKSEVLTKVILINQLYSTGLNDTVSTKTISVGDMAKHIVGCKEFDAKIKYGALSAFTWIGKIEEKEKSYNKTYSFASKYCNWHNTVVYDGDDYPIMDSYTKDFIYYWCQCCGEKVTRDDVSDYETFCKLMKKFKESKDGANLEFKVIDSFLWLYGKYGNPE